MNKTKSSQPKSLNYRMLPKNSYASGRKVIFHGVKRTFHGVKRISHGVKRTFHAVKYNLYCSLTI